MNVSGKHYRTIWLKSDDDTVIQIIDQRHLPHRFVIEDLSTVDEVAVAIKDMHVRGAGLIGATAGYGMHVAALGAPRDCVQAFTSSLMADAEKLKATRPTAVNLEWAVSRQLEAADSAGDTIEGKLEALAKTAQEIADEDADFCRRIGEHGVPIIEEISKRKSGDRVNILTHCNAGWLSSITARPLPPSMPRTTRGSRYMCGSTKPGRAIREPG